MQKHIERNSNVLKLEKVIYFIQNRKRTEHEYRKILITQTIFTFGVRRNRITI